MGNLGQVQGRRAEYEIRVARTDDLPLVRKLDELCFPSGGVDQQPAAPGELEAGVQTETLYLVVNSTSIVAFLQLEQPLPHHIFIRSLAVHPEHRRQGLGTWLLGSFLASIDSDAFQSLAVTTVTSPRNVPMLRLLCSHGFVARNVIRDYFGADRDRLYCQLRLGVEFVNPDDQYLIPLSAEDQLYSLLASESYVVTGVTDGLSGPLFEVSRVDRDDAAALQASECEAGISFSTAILAALTFLLAFAFASARYPDAARAVLVIATLTSTASLIVYANASGEITRFRGTAFARHMKWGNLLSEYGGIYPFLLTLVLTFATLTRSALATWTVGVAFSVAFALYESSRFSIASRYPRTWPFLLPAAVTAVLPLLAVAFRNSKSGLWAWAGVALGILLIRTVVALPSDLLERRLTETAARITRR
jgi:ribosomal protein S18 acetylase RimI-like enzyme